MLDTSRQIYNTCCFSGYRPRKLPWGTNETDIRCAGLKIRLYEAILSAYETGYCNFISGMSHGSDMYFCEEVLKLKRDIDADITLEAAIPCPGQEIKWNEETRIRYRRILSECDYVTKISDVYTDTCMAERNRYMVDRSSLLICVYNGRFGGTMQTVNYAEKSGIKVIRLEP